MIKNSLYRPDPDELPYEYGQLSLNKSLTEGHYFLPAVTVGSGIHVYPFFLHFLSRFKGAFLEHF